MYSHISELPSQAYILEPKKHILENIHHESGLQKSFTLLPTRYLSSFFSISSRTLRINNVLIYLFFANQMSNKGTSP